MDDVSSLNLLAARILTIDAGSGRRAVSLPELLAALLTGSDVRGYPLLAAEQHGYWHRFLVRCAAKVLRERGWSVADAAGQFDLAEAIGTTLEALAPGGWHLYRADPARAAFLQPCSPGGDPVEDSYGAHPPSILTGALGAKGHERKACAVRELTPEQAVYALVEYQTAAIYGGRGSYGSQLLGSASGAGSGTPFMGVEIRGSLAETFRHDVSVMLGRWDEVRQAHGLEGDVWALWTEPWDGRTPLPSRRLDPAFIPTARFVRLGTPEDGVFRTVWFRSSEKARVEDLSGGGNLGDPFTPMVPDPKDPSRRKVRGTLDKGYDYVEVVRLLFAGGDGQPSATVAALQADDDGQDDALRVVFAGTAYEQGKTAGFHRRVVALPPGSGSTFRRPRTVRAVHEVMLPKVKEAKSALRGAARMYVTGDPRGRDGDERRVGGAADALESRVDALYVDRLLAYVARHAAGDEAWLAEWGEMLRGLSITLFDEAMPGLPTSTARRFERESAATGWLRWKLAALVPATEQEDAT